MRSSAILGIGTQARLTKTIMCHVNVCPHLNNVDASVRFMMEWPLFNNLLTLGKMCVCIRGVSKPKTYYWQQLLLVHMYYTRAKYIVINIPLLAWPVYDCVRWTSRSVNCSLFIFLRSQLTVLYALYAVTPFL